ncbi:hypothetical protein [Staphylococcus chromogenes]|uniref:hypothetical protein n=1 Tax=Staphylococcus chromogenes TaxID=46126 RepID=UPI000D1B54F5|nr:hypothetical protein [Staphylococcus chromogenes]PTF70247.1 hypothetical protein BUY01_05405 [Staphylococcus chromogenes]PTG54719.1 hypothetical protein BU692_10315 [Staphylococcus chromogenes]PTG83565.1 hypothetical protein BU665_05255 [Staphylococcus chromogenes]
MSDFITLEKTDWYKKLIQECDSYKQERDTLIEDITRLRAERDEYKRKLDDVVELFTRHINYKLSVSHNTWYINLRHKLDEVLKNGTR